VKLGAAVPVPLRLVDCGEPAALSVTERAAVKLAAETGLNVTEIVQLPPAASDVPQVLDWEKSLEFAPPIEMPLIGSGALPVLLRVIVCAALLVPDTAVKLSDAGVRVATGAATTAVEKSAITLSGALMVIVVDALLLFATLPVQLEKL